MVTAMADDLLIGAPASSPYGQGVLLAGLIASVWQARGLLLLASIWLSWMAAATAPQWGVNRRRMA